MMIKTLFLGLLAALSPLTYAANAAVCPSGTTRVVENFEEYKIGTTSPRANGTNVSMLSASSRLDRQFPDPFQITFQTFQVVNATDTGLIRAASGSKAILAQDALYGNIQSNNTNDGVYFGLKEFSFACFTTYPFTFPVECSIQFTTAPFYYHAGNYQAYGPYKFTPTNVVGQAPGTSNMTRVVLDDSVAGGRLVFAVTELVSTGGVLFDKVVFCKQ